MGRVYEICHKGHKVKLYSVTSWISLFNDLGFYEKRSIYRNAEESITIGNNGHRLIKQILRGKGVSMGQWRLLDPKSKNVLMAFKRWKDHTGFKPLHVELRVHSLRYAFGGTLDAIGWINGEIVLVDWKTGLLNERYIRLQLVLYFIAYLERYPRRKIHGLRGVYFNKNTGEFSEFYISLSEIKEIFHQFIEYLERTDISLIRQWGGLESLEFRKKIVGGIEMESTKAIATKQNSSLSQSPIYGNAMEILKTWYPFAPEADRMKAAQLIWYYKAPPNKVYLIPRKNGARAKAIGCTCDKFENCPHKSVYDWVLTVGIEVSRMVSSRGRAIQYIDGPRYMTEEEEMKFFKKTNPEKIRFITYLRDAKSGASAWGHGEIDKNVRVMGAEGGNSLENLASYRSERKALSRLPTVDTVIPEFEVNEGLTEIPIPSKQLETYPDLVTGEIIEGKEGQVSEVAQQPQEAFGIDQASSQAISSKESKPDNSNHPWLKKCWIPEHQGAKWKPDRYHNLDHFVDQNTYCKFKKILQNEIAKVIKEKGMLPVDAEVILETKYQKTWAKLSNESSIELYEFIKTLSPKQYPSNIFKTEIDGMAKDLGWTDLVLKQFLVSCSYPKVVDLKQLTTSQRDDFKNKMLDQIATNAKKEPQKPLL